MDQAPGFTRILIIDDDTKLLKLMSEYLSQFSMEVITAVDADQGLRLLEKQDIQLVVLDVMMPGIDGWEACREIRRQSDIPVLMLSARGEALDRIVGLELGADDYMSKPFEPRELVTRIRAILRRSSNGLKDHHLVFQQLEIHPQAREAYMGNLCLELTSMEFELLYLLARYPGRKFSRDELMSHLQGFESGKYGRSVDILISRLRAKLGEDARRPRYIKSVHGFGYVFIGDQR